MHIEPKLRHSFFTHTGSFVSALEKCAVVTPPPQQTASFSRPPTTIYVEVSHQDFCFPVAVQFLTETPFTLENKSTICSRAVLSKQEVTLIRLLTNLPGDPEVP
jgi:hypothetical protein